MMLTITPIYTLTGWTWHIPLRRDIGVAMFVTAVLDLVPAALTTGEEFSGGVLGRLGGHSFLLVGRSPRCSSSPSRSPRTDEHNAGWVGTGSDCIASST